MIHTFVDRSDYAGTYAPGFHRIKDPAAAGSGQTLLNVDHCVGNVALGDMNRFVDFYREVLGFSQLVHFDDKVIHTEYSALMSKVMQNGDGRIKFPINEPAEGKRKSQIQEFLDYYLDAGTQHIALLTTDIAGTVRVLRERGVEFLGLPHEYFAALPDRVGDVGIPIDTLEELGSRPTATRRATLPDLHQADPGPPDVLLRDHRAPRLAWLRARELQGPVRGHRAGAGEARQPLGLDLGTPSHNPAGLHGGEGTGIPATGCRTTGSGHALGGWVQRGPVTPGSRSSRRPMRPSASNSTSSRVAANVCWSLNPPTGASRRMVTKSPVSEKSWAMPVEHAEDRFTRDRGGVEAGIGDRDPDAVPELQNEGPLPSAGPENQLLPVHSPLRSTRSPFGSRRSMEEQPAGRVGRPTSEEGRVGLGVGDSVQAAITRPKAVAAASARGNRPVIGRRLVVPRC